MSKLDLRPIGGWHEDDEKRREEAYARAQSARAPGPDLRGEVCGDCGEFAPWNDGTYLYCAEHVPHEIRYRDRHIREQRESSDEPASLAAETAEASSQCLEAAAVCIKSSQDLKAINIQLLHLISVANSEIPEIPELRAPSDDAISKIRESVSHATAPDDAPPVAQDEGQAVTTDEGSLPSTVGVGEGAAEVESGASLDSAGHSSEAAQFVTETSPGERTPSRNDPGVVQDDYPSRVLKDKLLKQYAATGQEHRHLAAFCGIPVFRVNEILSQARSNRDVRVLDGDQRARQRVRDVERIGAVRMKIED